MSKKKRRWYEQNHDKSWVWIVAVTLVFAISFGLDLYDYLSLRKDLKNENYATFTGEFYYDYHFMRQTNTGQWAEKHGCGGASILWDVGMTPDTIPWTLGGIPYYDSEIIYYAVGN